MFISLEGGEGAGKSFFQKAFAQHLKSLGKNVVLTREPGGTPVADEIRSVFNCNNKFGEKIEPLTELFLVCAARTQHVQNLIRPALARGDWVICDRFYDSTRIYQGVLGGVDSKVIETALDWCVGDCHPNLTLWIDCPVDVVMNRLGERGSEDGIARFDDMAKSMHEKLRQGFMRLEESFADRFFKLNGEASAEENIALVMSEIEMRNGR